MLLGVGRAVAQVDLDEAEVVEEDCGDLFEFIERENLHLVSRIMKFFFQFQELFTVLKIIQNLEVTVQQL